MRLQIFAVALLTMAMPLSTNAQQNTVPEIAGPTYLTTYVEVVPSAGTQAVNMLKDYRDAARKEPGAMHIDIYREKGQLHRFVLGELWQNRTIVQDHMKSAATTALEQKLKPIELGPPDVRIHQAHSVTPPKAPNAGDVIIISHVDVFGGNVSKLIALLNTLGEASQKDNGMVRYEILDEVPAHVNHFRVLEEWASAAAWEAHDRAPHTQAYREALMPMLGTPYDQRLYDVVN
jgi:quinol monooxygenase YgiN